MGDMSRGKRERFRCIKKRNPTRHTPCRVVSLRDSFEFVVDSPDLRNDEGLTPDVE